MDLSFFHKFTSFNMQTVLPILDGQQPAPVFARPCDLKTQNVIGLMFLRHHHLGPELQAMFPDCYYVFLSISESDHLALLWCEKLASGLTQNYQPLKSLLIEELPLGSYSLIEKGRAYTRTQKELYPDHYDTAFHYFALALLGSRELLHTYLQAGEEEQDSMMRQTFATAIQDMLSRHPKD